MNISKKKEYNSPEICSIQFDNEISLVLASSEDANPGGEPGWSQNQNGMQSDPFKNNLG